MKIDKLKSLAKKFNKKTTILVIVAVVVVAGLLLFLVIHNSSNKSEHEAEAPNPGYYQTEDELNGNKHQVQVNLTADGPQPQTLRVPVDTLIGWQNQDSKDHVLAISPGTKMPDRFYNNRKIEPSGGYMFLIHQTGTYHYYDVTDPTHGGEIIVSDK